MERVEKMVFERRKRLWGFRTPYRVSVPAGVDMAREIMRR